MQICEKLILAKLEKQTMFEFEEENEHKRGEHMRVEKEIPLNRCQVSTGSNNSQLLISKD